MPQLREVPLAEPVVITRSNKELRAINFAQRDDGMVLCTATWAVPQADGSMRVVAVTIEDPVAAGILTAAQLKGLADKVRDATKDELLATALLEILGP